MTRNLRENSLRGFFTPRKSTATVSDSLPLSLAAVPGTALFAMRALRLVTVAAAAAAASPYPPSPPSPPNPPPPPPYTTPPGEGPAQGGKCPVCYVQYFQRNVRTPPTPHGALLRGSGGPF